MSYGDRGAKVHLVETEFFGDMGDVVNFVKGVDENWFLLCIVC